MIHDPGWRRVLGAVLTLYVAAGLYVALRPDRWIAAWCWLFLKRYQRARHRDGIRAAGVLMAAGALWMLYRLLTGAI